jgi:uncharacterized membrane protein YbhN (UPF0104 family)
MDKRHLKILLKIVISCLFIGYLFFKVDVTSLAATMGSIDASLYVISTLLAVISGIIVSAKYYFLVKGTSINHSLVSLVKINFITRFYALFLPSALGREVVRWIKVTRNKKGKAQFLAVIVFERLTFLFVLLLCGIIPLFFYKSNPAIEILRLRILPIATIGICIVSVFILFYIFPPIRNSIKPLVYRTLQRIRRPSDANNFLGNYRLDNLNTNTFVLILGLSLFLQIFFIYRILILIRAASIPLSFMDVTWIGSLVLLLQTIPISFAGIGLREGAYAYLFTLFYLPPEKGVLIGILFFSQMLIIAAVGGILEFVE